jgi:hypothetical protein
MMISRRGIVGLTAVGQQKTEDNQNQMELQTPSVEFHGIMNLS